MNRLGDVRISVGSILWATGLLLFFSVAWAAKADLDGTARALDSRVTTPEDRAVLFTKFGIPTTAPFGTLPPGQALVLWSLCGTNAACQQRALADRRGHQGWGEVAKDLKAMGLVTDERLGHALRQATEAHRDLVAKGDRGAGISGERHSFQESGRGAFSARPERLSDGMGRGRR